MMTVLVVDDEEWLLELLPEKIQEVDRSIVPPQVLTASTPEEALVVADQLADRKDRPTVVVLSDYHLGGRVDGIELLAKIAKRLPDARRVLMSGRTDKELRGRVKEADLHGFIEKPMTLREWGPVLARALEEEPVLG